MQKIHFKIDINAPKDKVHKIMLDRPTYIEWTKAFDGNSDFEGDWSPGSFMKFGPVGGDGMYAEVVSNTSDFVSIRHVGMIINGEVDTESEEVKKWTPAFENYTFTESNGITTVSIDVDSAEEYVEMFSVMWPKALDLLRQICER